MTYESFADCIEALMAQCGLREPMGGLVVKTDGGYAFSLHGQPQPEGEPFVEVNPSIVPGETWRASFLNWPEAEEGYQAFVREFPLVLIERDES